MNARQLPTIEETALGVFLHDIGKFMQRAWRLLRIGRFSHFESLSVDGLRSGWDAQRRRPIEGMGSSRSLCMITDRLLAPFGWVLLEPL